MHVYLATMAIGRVSSQLCPLDEFLFYDDSSDHGRLQSPGLGDKRLLSARNDHLNDRSSKLRFGDRTTSYAPGDI
ncbi:hypothetical protein L227DRAFT_378673 [Lentinus tigrinus ALCF2SS1-6]|uniref:Uncharacterized protein n=1 Tax=Lentinus tigrinus ALCF2SS1-6 TaxID=1328759 RepID=A0A5C2RTB8_9APHY|nr:hypothetical protein L227DRAFT_378673 [Lentinus tigrinus ALCF2SS1-6]